MVKRRRRGGTGIARQGGQRVPRRPVPADLMARYLTPDEAFGAFTRMGAEPLDWLRGADQASVLCAIAAWISRFDTTDLAGWKAIEREWVGKTIAEPHRSRLLAVLGDDATLVGPQSLMLVAKRAITLCRPSAVTDMRPLLTAAVAIQGELARDSVPDQDATDRDLVLLTEMIRIQEFHRRPDETMRVAQSQLRWREIPGRDGIRLSVPVADAFEQVTGVPLLDSESVGLSLFAHAIKVPGGVVSLAEMAGAIGWERDRLDAVLRVISATLDDAAAAIRRDDRSFGEAWAFDPLRQFPVLRLDTDRVLVLSPHLLLERTFGWLPFLDMTHPEHATAEATAIAKRAKQAFETICEREVVETLAANVAAGRKRGRLFDGATLGARYRGGMIADAAIAYADEWVVVEVSSGQLKRETVVGGSTATLDEDLARLVDEKVAQIEATIAHIRADPARLLGEARRRRRFVPVLVFAEGVPLNPMTHVAIAERLAAAGALSDADVEPLHILDTEDLYVAETMAETDRLGINEILEQHRHAGMMRRVELGSWLGMEGRLRKPRPSRLDADFRAAVALIDANVGRVATLPVEAARGEARPIK